MRIPLLPTLATIPALFILMSLGFWQLDRLEWKQGLINQVQTKHSAAPVPLIEVLGDVQAEYRPVTVLGTFDHDAELYLHAIGPGGMAGHHVITPLTTLQGLIVLVDRGFVPPEKMDPVTRQSGQVGGEVFVTGLVRFDSEINSFTPPNEPDGNRWYSRNRDEMVAALGLPDKHVAQVFIEADATENPGGWPKGGQTRITFKNDHLEYALTWFGLAATLVGVFIAYVISLNRKPD